MFQLGKTIVSEDILEKKFVCDLSSCKGECCVVGDAGAPLSKEETQVLEKIYPKVKPFLREEGIVSIEKQGTWIANDSDEPETPLINDAECAYVIFDEKGTALCGIEEAYNKNIIDWKKPISCHLYPVRVQDYSEFSALNYHQWDICDDACSLGKEFQVPVYKFLKEALTRRFGENWYKELVKVAEQKQK